MNRRAFLHSLLGASVTGAAAATATATACACGEDTHDLEITRVPFHLGLQTPLRLAVLGDLHFDPVYEEAYLAHVISLVNGLQPDLIAYTGDFVTSRLDRVADLARILASAQAPLGAYALEGNHEFWTNTGYVLKLLDRLAGIRMLLNSSIALPNEDNVFLTFLRSMTAGPIRTEVLESTPHNARHIVLAHEPDSFPDLTNPRIRLQISGHTHGGQVRLPFYGALVLPKWGRDYQEGRYAASDGRQLYVNRGIGTLFFHHRFNCRPEITLFELT